MSDAKWSDQKKWMMGIVASLIVAAVVSFGFERLKGTEPAGNPKTSTNEISESDAIPVGQNDRALLTVRCTVHLQDIGDKHYVSPSSASGQPIWLGTIGQKRRLEGFKFTVDGIPNDQITYQAHIADNQWSDWKTGGEWVGPIRGKAVEAIRVKLKEPAAKQYELEYSAHVKGQGNLGPVSDGTYCGTIGKGWQVEAIKIDVTSR